MDKHPLKELSERFLSEQNLSKVTIKNYRICYKYYIRYPWWKMKSYMRKQAMSSHLEMD